MARKRATQRNVRTTPVTRARVEKALRERRAEEALGLAKTLYQLQATGDHKDLLKQAYLLRCRELLSQDRKAEAFQLLTRALEVDNGPVFLADIACEIAACGDPARALQLAEQIDVPEQRYRVLSAVADESVRLGDAGRGHLPEALRADFDHVLDAFREAEAGRDELARDALKGIGLKSPFLEWKVFLRGLLAYNAGDDPRALDNWQRLAPDRWPFRLAAPLRFQIDRDFAVHQSPEAQRDLQRKADRLLGSPLFQKLREVQAAIDNEDKLPDAFRLADKLRPLLRAEAPDLLGRLAKCFYWAIIHHGLPEDMRRFRQTFDAVPDDPDLTRLEALALELRGQFQTAHELWQKYEKSVAKNTFWPDDQRDHVRALVWQRMGENADTIPDLPDDLMPDFLRDHPGRPRPLKPSAEFCYEQSLKLVPDNRAAYEALLRHHLRRREAKKAEAVARRLLQRFPDHAPTLETLGDLQMESEEYAGALDSYEKSLHANPLEQRLRLKVSDAHAYNARRFVEGGQFDEARRQYQSALSMDTRRNQYAVLCKWAACEFKAGDEAKARELLDRAMAEKSSRLAVVFSLLIELIRFKLSKLKKQYNDEFNALLDEKPTGTAAAALAATAAAHQQAGVKYHGQQTHEKKVLKYLEKALQAEFTEEGLKQICASLMTLRKPRLQYEFIRLAQRQHPKNPYFYIAEVQYLLDRGPYGFAPWQASDALDRARKLATAMPRGDEQQQLLQQIQKLEAGLALLNPFSRLLGGMGGMGGMFDAYDDGYDEEYDDGY